MLAASATGNILFILINILVEKFTDKNKNKRNNFLKTTFDFGITIYLLTILNDIFAKIICARCIADLGLIASHIVPLLYLKNNHKNKDTQRSRNSKRKRIRYAVLIYILLKMSGIIDPTKDVDVSPTSGSPTSPTEEGERTHSGGGLY